MSKYGKSYSVPKEFPSVLKAFTREVLRSQPGDIYEFGAQYFTELLAQEEATAAAESAGPRRLSPEELQELLATMFHEADADSSGALNPTEFKEVLKMADIGLSDREVKRVMAEADFNDDGEVSYEEFVPLAVDLVTTMYAKMDAEAERAADEEAAREEAKNYLLHGMTKEEVEGVMTDIFHKADADGSGALSLQEFRQCCRDADIGLTRKEINILMHQCDVDGDGHISYEEFVPLCFEMLTEIMKDELLKEARPPSELEEYLKEVFMEADPAMEGRLDPLTLKKVIRDADLGLTRLQIHSILADAEYDEDGLCAYGTIVTKAADLIARILDVDAQMERRSAIEAMAGDLSTVKGGLDAGQIEAVLLQEFAGADSSGSGVVTVAVAQKVLSSSQLGLSGMEVNALLSTLDGEYAPLCGYAFYILQYLAEEAMFAGR